VSDDLIGKQVVDPHGYKVGKIDSVFGREGGENACWALVKTGLRSSSFVPLHDAQEDDDGVRVVYEKEHIKKAPDVETHDQEISDEDSDVLHQHYGLERVAVSTVQEDDVDLPRETREATPPDMSELPPAYDRHPIP
jgi:hypothetical protein